VYDSGRWWDADDHIVFYPRFRIEDLAIGIDKFVPIIPLMLIAYSECLNGLLKRFSLEKHMKKIVAVVFVVLLAASAFAMFEHKQKQDHDFAVFKKIYSETPEGALIIVDENVSSLSPAFKETPYTGMFFTEFFGDRKLASIKEDFSKYMEDESKTFVMKIKSYPSIEVEIIPISETGLLKK